MPSDEYLWRARIENEWADTKAAAKRAEGAEARAAELEDELRRRQEIIDDARIRLDDRLHRAEAAEARIAEMEALLDDAEKLIVKQKAAREAAEAKVAELEAELSAAETSEEAWQAEAERLQARAEQGCRGFEMNRQPMAAVDQCAHCGRRRREHEGDDLFPARKVSDPQPRE